MTGKVREEEEEGEEDGVEEEGEEDGDVTETSAAAANAVR